MLHGVLLYNVYRVCTGTQEECPKREFRVHPSKLATFLGCTVGIAALKENRTN